MTRQRVFPYAILGFVLLIVAGAGLAYSFGSRAYRATQNARANLSLAEQALLNEQDFTKAATALAQAHGELTAARKNARRIFYLRIVPWLGRQHKASVAMLSAAEISAGALTQAIELTRDLYTPLQARPEREIGALTLEQRQELLRKIDNALPTLNKVFADLKSARARLHAVPVSGLILPLQEDAEKFKTRLAVALQITEDSLPLLEIAPQFLGYPEAKTYLFVLQNSDELRPTGGFIGTYGILTFEAGHIAEFFTDDVYNLDRYSPARTRPDTPTVLKTYLQQPKWFLRDANWNPDFKVSAQRILQFYREEVRFIPPDRKEFAYPQVDGLIAVAPEAIKPILALVGPITVEGQTFNAQNLTDALEFEVEIGFEGRGIPRPQRKAIISKLGHELIAKVMALPTSKWAEVLHLTRQALDERQILLYSEDSALQERISDQSWSGELFRPNLSADEEKSGRDYLAVFDANMFALKTDPYVSRTIFYKVEKEGDVFTADVELVYNYPKAGPAWKTKGYRTYTRVYVPQGSILQFARGAMKDEDSGEPGEVEIGQELDKTFFGAFLAVQVGEEKRLRFRYRLPEPVGQAIDSEGYGLTIQKQPGTQGHALTVVLNFDKVPKLWEPRGLQAQRQGNQLIWQTNLRRDQVFSVGFSQ
ncbi:DUF4012 domain-containing protein [Candidatus Uhrbacteria bacterium]|nr:DUF4012 domain-containing protein [Candidatus Uhrbacteria bacterium]